MKITDHITLTLASGKSEKSRCSNCSQLQICFSFSMILLYLTCKALLIADVYELCYISKLALPEAVQIENWVGSFLI